MTPGLVVFEDAHWRDLRPLTDLIPVPLLAFGGSDLSCRWARRVGAPGIGMVARPAALAGRAAHAAVPRDADDLLCVNAAALPDRWVDAVLADPTPAIYRVDERVVAARGPRRTLAAALERAGSGEEEAPLDRALSALGLREVAIEAPLLRRPWDLVTWNERWLRADLDGPARRDGSVHPQAVLLEPERIAVAAGARVDALAVLDARDGPIRIEADAIVQPFTHVIGPCRIGAGTHLLGGVVSNSTIGPGCRIAGEVDSCVWQGWANKRHHGFVGHSVIGEWVNLGALTTTSDLKNNYGEVRVRVDGRELSSGTNKLGSIVGAHVKTGIGTLLPTGAVVGTGANLFGGGRFAPRSVAPFTWWDGAGSVEHELERFLATARTAMKRRDRELDGPAEGLLRSLHAATRAERATA